MGMKFALPRVQPRQGVKMRPYFALALGMLVFSVEAREWGFSKDTVFQSYVNYFGPGNSVQVIDTFYIDNNSTEEISLDSGKLEIVKPSNSPCNFSLNFGIEPNISVLPFETHKSGFLQHSYDSLKVGPISKMILGRNTFYANGVCPADSFLVRAIVYSGNFSDSVLVKTKWEDVLLGATTKQVKRKIQKFHSTNNQRNTLGRILKINH